MRLGLAQNRPLLLAAMQYFRPPELKRLLRALIAWGVRGLLVGGLGGGTSERIYADTAVKIRAGSVHDTDEVFQELATTIPSDTEFQAAFEQARIANSKLARYYLLAFERRALGTQEPEYVPNANEEEVNVEHVLPRNPVLAQWLQFSGDEVALSVTKLGNLVLLKKSQNERIGNQPFAEKSQSLPHRHIHGRNGRAIRHVGRQRRLNSGKRA